MKDRIIPVLLAALLIFSLSGCGIVQEIRDQVDIANTFADFAPGFSEVLEGAGVLSSKAADTLDSSVSMEIEVNPPPEAALLDNNDYLEISISISGVSKEGFIAFLEAGSKESAPDELPDEWEEYDELRNAGISNIIVFANDTPFDEDTEFNSDTISAIRGMIDVNGNEGILQALLEMEIGELTYDGNLVVGFIKVDEDWKINSLNIELSPGEES